MTIYNTTSFGAVERNQEYIYLDIEHFKRILYNFSLIDDLIKETDAGNIIGDFEIMIKENPIPVSICYGRCHTTLEIRDEDYNRSISAEIFSDSDDKVIHDVLTAYIDQQYEKIETASLLKNIKTKRVN